MDWLPTLSGRPGPVYRRIVDALSNDIASGRLRRGQQLPTHRALAQALRIDLTTVTRAYGEARRRGLLDARVGQGTFVSETTARATADIPHPVKIDLSMNCHRSRSRQISTRASRKGLQSIQKEAGFTAFLNYQRPGGSDEDREPPPSGCERACRVQAANACYLSGQPGGNVQCALSLDVARGCGAN